MGHAGEGRQVKKEKTGFSPLAIAVATVLFLLLVGFT
jgi:hypothetical protein